LPPSVQSETSKDHYDLQQLNPEAEISQFYENTAAGNKRTYFKDVISSILTNKNDKVLELIGN
jgi:hypothetical protein